MFSKILIANRGEIAVRIIRACKDMGISTVAVYSQADKDALHVSMADEAYCIGPAKVKDSYLNMTAIITAAAISHAEAIHPGYGLLSENPKFAALCEECNITFIGPKSDIIKKMGDKDNARRTVSAVGVPIVPGTDLLKNADDAKEHAERIGYPVLIKARAGGGGRGIRLVNSADEITSAYNSAKSEAEAAFGDGNLYMEKFVFPVKHIEMQVISDNFGNVVCLGERECSVQRKNQKLIEESPSVAVSEEIRRQMSEAAKAAVKATNYTGLGTIEFLFDKNNNFYFMEMNTRLQVEHTVTEMVTGIDLVRWQIRVAANIPLGFTQEDVRLSGHAIECRINAEDPDDGFKPCCGKITTLHVPGGPWVRFDTAIYQDYSVPPFYDSMIGKLIVCANNREEAVRKMRAALCELILEGVTTNTDLHLDILSDTDFNRGTYTTDFLKNRGL